MNLFEAQGREKDKQCLTLGGDESKNKVAAKVLNSRALVAERVKIKNKISRIIIIIIIIFKTPGNENVVLNL